MGSLLHQNHFFLFFPAATHQKPFAPQNPFSVFLKIKSRSFRSSNPKASPLECYSIQSSNLARRVSRVAMNEAQDVLFDYLHAARGYSFKDAEYISKNSPHFVQSLVSRMDGHDNDDDDAVARSLTKFLRYNPINEFEPFLESLGINASELTMFLPRGMMFLVDDYLLLDNFHALSDYGIPRSRMGEIYKQAKEIFGYPSGILSSKFRAYENLGLSKSTVIKLACCSPSLLIGESEVNSDFSMVLDWLKNIGIENDWIGNYLSCSRTYNWKRMFDTIQFLHKMGYSEKQMHNLFKGNPALLLEGVGKKVSVFFGRSLKLGLKMNVIYSSFIEYPHMLTNSSAKNLLKVVDFLYDIGMGTDDIVHILSNHMHLLSSHRLKASRTVRREFKVGKADLCQMIKDDPLKLISLASKLQQKSTERLFGHEPIKHLEKTTFLMKLGYAENSEEMAKALKRFRGRRDQLQERFDCLVEAGLDYDIVIQMIKRAPNILCQRKVVIRKKIEYLTNILGYPLESAVRFPSYFTYDLERIIQRFSMYVWLKERNAANPMLTLSTILACSEEKFVKYFVNVHPEGPTIWKRLKSSSYKD